MAADPWVPCASKVSIEVSLCSYCQLTAISCAHTRIAYVERGETGAVLIEGLVVELDELL
jgi:hypothetical protein